VLDFLQELAFIFERLNWTSVLDISLVTLIFFLLLLLVRKTQAMTLLRGVIFLIIALLILTQVVNLPAFRWLIVTAMPTLLFAVPVIFAPEIRRGLQRIGRTGANSLFMGRSLLDSEAYMAALQAEMVAVNTLSGRKHGALMVLQRNEYLEEYVDTGVRMDAQVTAELLLQIFFPNTPLHDGAVIIDKARIVAAACVLPLSSSGVLSATPERKMGLRHRAGLGIAESSDALVVIVSEETGSVSIAQQGELIHDISLGELEVELMSYYHLQRERSWKTVLKDLFKPNQLKTDPDVFDDEENE
jgi:diadenylate cyclase